ncbi:MAG: cysteine desulfurase family protein [Planctomycetota bacterium]
MTSDEIIYLDNHATTRVDPRVLEAMLPTFDRDYANAGSVTHRLGQAVHELAERARAKIASLIGAVNPSEIVFTSGATESNNLAIRGYCQRVGSGHIITTLTEHQAVLAPVNRLEQSGFQVTRLGVLPHHSPHAGLIDLEQFSAALRPETILVSVMLANNEIGAIQPIAEISRICSERGIVLHCDATQGVGKLPVDVEQLGVDLLSFTSHKLHGPKGIGALYIRSRGRRVRLQSQIEGGGQEAGRRGGTLNVSGIVGFARALELVLESREADCRRMGQLRDEFYRLLRAELGELPINGPPLADRSRRLSNNLNCQFPGLDGHSLMVGSPRLAMSSGSACTATSTEPSHVLTALGLDRDQVRSSLRFGLSRWTTPDEIETAVGLLAESARQLRKLGGAGQ